mgnify:CR=1|jgi:hypothetical protein
MRTYILTKLERQLLRGYLDNGKTPDAFHVLMNRITKYHSILEKDLSLIKKGIEKRKTMSK